MSFTAKCSRVNIFTVLQAAASLVMGVVFVKFQLFSALLQLTWHFLNVSLELLHWILLTSETYVFMMVGAECLTVASFVMHILSSEAVHLDLGFFCLIHRDKMCCKCVLIDEECLLLERKQKEFDIDLPKWGTINDGEHMNISQAYTICP